jgi:hypothetical protein
MNHMKERSVVPPKYDDVILLGAIVMLIGRSSAGVLARFATRCQENLRAPTSPQLDLNASNTAPFAGNQSVLASPILSTPSSNAFTLPLSHSALHTPSNLDRRLLHHLRQRLPPTRQAGQEEASAIRAEMAEATSW